MKERFLRFDIEVGSLGGNRFADHRFFRGSNQHLIGHRTFVFDPQQPLPLIVVGVAAVLLSDELTCVFVARSAILNSLSLSRAKRKNVSAGNTEARNSQCPETIESH